MALLVKIFKLYDTVVTPIIDVAESHDKIV
jgi:hypothetical protein